MEYDHNTTFIIFNFTNKSKDNFIKMTCINKKTIYFAILKKRYFFNVVFARIINALYIIAKSPHYAK